MPTRVATFLRRLSRFAQRAVVLVRRVPITAAVFVTVLVAGLITEAQETNYWPILVQRFGWDLTTLQHWRIYSAWVGLFFSPEPVDFYGILALLLLTLGPLELRRGTRLCSDRLLRRRTRCEHHHPSRSVALCQSRR